LNSLSCAVVGSVAAVVVVCVAAITAAISVVAQYQL
jgi:hypothetical protein